MEDSPVWTLGPLRFDPDRPDSRGVLWFLSEETGFFGAPGTTAEVAQRLNAHGGLRSPGWKTERTITLSGYAFAPDYRKLRYAVNEITGILAEPNTPLTLTCHAENGPMTAEVYLDGDILTTPLDIQRPGIEFSLQVVAPDPRKYGATWRTWRADLPSLSTGDGLDFEAGAPDTGGGFGSFSTFSLSTTAEDIGLDFAGGLKFGASNATGIMQITNAGTAPSWPVYRLYGPLINPTLTVTEDGIQYQLRYNQPLAPGEMVVIDPAAPSVLLGGTATRRHLLNPAQFSAFAVPGSGAHWAGLNVGLTHEGESTSEGYVTATLRDAWF